MTYAHAVADENRFMLQERFIFFYWSILSCFCFCSHSLRVFWISNYFLISNVNGFCQSWQLFLEFKYSRSYRNKLVWTLNWLLKRFDFFSMCCLSFLAVGFRNLKIYFFQPVSNFKFIFKPKNILKQMRLGCFEIRFMKVIITWKSFYRD